MKKVFRKQSRLQKQLLKERNEILVSYYWSYKKKKGFIYTDQRIREHVGAKFRLHPESIRRIVTESI